mmetsp:Transcript_28451/g.94451  ORF Transcript_28451/g.94451 Transcript_28451/m.94451 type:complete len:201 (-) Transcript_28451:18-620(-)
MGSQMRRQPLGADGCDVVAALAMAVEDAEEKGAIACGTAGRISTGLLLLRRTGRGCILVDPAGGAFLRARADLHVLHATSTLGAQVSPLYALGDGSQGLGLGVTCDLDVVGSREPHHRGHEPIEARAEAATASPALCLFHYAPRGWAAEHDAGTLLENILVHRHLGTIQRPPVGSATKRPVLGGSQLQALGAAFQARPFI